LYIRGTSELGGEETVKVGLVYLRGMLLILDSEGYYSKHNP